MKLPLILHFIMTYISILLAMAFFTLLERKGLGYFQIRKGPNKVSIMGLPQPMADAMKLFTKEINYPSMSNISPFIVAPAMGLALALILWTLYPSQNPLFFMTYGILFFLCVSSINVYTTLGAGWSSNSKYSLLGALRSVAQTISYEVSMALTLLSPILMMASMNLNDILMMNMLPMFLLFPSLMLVWFTTTLAESNRTPFDFAEGESELVSGFNTEYSGGIFALIFMAEYINIMMMSMLTAVLFFTPPFKTLSSLIIAIVTMIFVFTFIWVRASYPRMRYDRLMQLTWKSFLPFSLVTIILMMALSYIL